MNFFTIVFTLEILVAGRKKLCEVARSPDHKSAYLSLLSRSSLSVLDGFRVSTTLFVSPDAFQLTHGFRLSQTLPPSYGPYRLL